MGDQNSSQVYPFTSPYPEPVSNDDSPTEAELSEGATQPPTDRPPPPDPPDPTPIAETDAATRQQSQESDRESWGLLPQISSDENSSDDDQEEDSSVWSTVTTSLRDMTLMDEERMDDAMYHQRLVLYGLRMLNGRNISMAGLDLMDGHPIAEAVLLIHAKSYINEHDMGDIDLEQGLGLYYRADFVVARPECRSGRPVVASKNTTPYRKFLLYDDDSAISDLEAAWANTYFGEEEIYWHRNHPSSVNVTSVLFLAVLFRSAFVSIRYQHLLSPLSPAFNRCAPYRDFILRTMDCLIILHQAICDTLIRVKRANRFKFRKSVCDMQNSTSKYLVYHCDSKHEFPYKFIEFPHFVVINLHRGGEDIKLALLYMQVPPYYFGIPVSLNEQRTTTAEEYQDLISSSGEFQEINKYFPVIIKKVNETLEGERDAFYTLHRPDLRKNPHVLQIHPYRFDEKGKPDWCRYLEISIHDNI